MGVPAFFASLIKNSLVSILRKSEEVGIIDCLYFDLNCLIHPQCFKILDKNVKITNFDILEGKMIDYVIEYINHVIRFVSPKKYVYFSVDGTAPLAKISQQRKRRFDSSNNYKIEIMKKYNIQHSSWSNVVITPGTEFMERLHLKLIEYYSNKNNLDDYPNLEILYSSYHIPGEGEHKILQDMKMRYANNKELNIAIYGLDADLLFLSMASNIKNIFLVREDSTYGQKTNEIDKNNLYIFESLTYVDMDSTINEINKMIRKEIDMCITENSSLKVNYDCESFIDDYILFCFLLGNDFLPHFYSLDIKRGGMEIAVKSYVKAFIRNKGLKIIERNKNTGDIKINTKVFIDYISIIAHGENDFFKYKLHKNINNERMRKRCYEKEEWKKEIWKIENLIDIKEPDEMKLGIDDETTWNYNYYKVIGAEGKLQKSLKKDMCMNYIEGIMWVFNYYFKECSDYTWQYNFHYSPLMKDLNEFLHDIPNFDMNKIIFEKKKSIPIFVQLLAVLPTTFNKYLPSSYKFLTEDFDSPIIDLFPTKYKIDFTYQTQRFKCPQLIPFVDISRLLLSTDKLKLTNEEKIRSKQYVKYIKLN
jgi:5'-3' exonuclease